MMKKNHSEEFQQLWSDSKYNRGPLVSLIVLRVALCIGIVMFVISSLVNVAAGLLLVIATAVILFFIYSKRLKNTLYNWNVVSCVTSRPAKRNKNASLPSSNVLSNIYLTGISTSPTSKCRNPLPASAKR